MDAWELWEKLESRKNFSAWIYYWTHQTHFKEGKDYIVIWPKVDTTRFGGHNRKDFLLSLDMAKHLCMVAQVFARVAANDLSGGLPLPMKTVQDLADMSQPSISRTVATLTGVGYLQNGKRVGGLDWVQTTNDITDLKAKLLMLSPPGREVAQRLIAILTAGRVAGA